MHNKMISKHKVIFAYTKTFLAQKIALVIIPYKNKNKQISRNNNYTVLLTKNTIIIS